jgi:hypothetical protein
MARRTLQAHGAVHEIDQLPADGQSEPRPAELAGHAAIGLLEGVEDALLFLRRHADARIRHGKFQCGRRIARRRGGDG